MKLEDILKNAVERREKLRIAQHEAKVAERELCVALIDAGYTHCFSVNWQAVRSLEREYNK